MGVALEKVLALCQEEGILFLPDSSSGKESACKRLGFDPWVGKIPWRRAWQPTPVFLPGESHGQRSLAGWGGGYSPWGHKESDMTEHAHIHTSCSLSLKEASSGNGPGWSWKIQMHVREDVGKH